MSDPIARDPQVVAAKFDRVRAYLDDRIAREHLDELELWMLRDNALLAMHDRIAQVQEEIMFGRMSDAPSGEVIPFPGHSVRV
jgi:hypothetical protein